MAAHNREAGAADVFSRLPPEWIVSVSLPIEADSPADAVRAFWAYVQGLGPTELPAFVWPRGDELALQAYLLGEPVSLTEDPTRTESQLPVKIGFSLATKARVELR